MASGSEGSLGREGAAARPAHDVAAGSTLVGDETYDPIRFGDFATYMRHKKRKLHIQEDDILKEDAFLDPERPLDRSVEDHVKKTKLERGKAGEIFRSCRIYINGYTSPSLQTLRRLIVQHGGTFMVYMDGKTNVTHIVASNLTPKKRVEFLNYKVVTPQWIVQSVEGGALLPWEDFKLLHGSSSQRVLTKPGAAALSQAASSQSSSPPKWSLSQAKDPYNSSYKAAQESSSASSIGQSERANVDLALGEASVPSHGGQIDEQIVQQNATRSCSEEKTRIAPHETDPRDLERAKHLPGYDPYRSNSSSEKALSDPAWRAAHTSVADGFIKGYYESSRLHYLSMWKAELKLIVGRAQAKASQQPRTAARNAASSKSRTIMHCDFDCFFASIGLRDRPALKDLPCVVCHGQGRSEEATSEIASSNYTARKFGVENGMSLGYARKLCPDLKTIPYEFELYRAASDAFYTILMSYADELQAVSVDEALIDVSSHIIHPLDETSREEEDLASVIRSEVRQATGIEISIGIGYNILSAKLASRSAKPAGQYFLRPHMIDSQIADLDVSSFPGVGWSMSRQLQEQFNVSKVKDLLGISKEALKRELGPKTGEMLFDYARGTDHRMIETSKPRKSVSVNINWGIRFENASQVQKFVLNLAKEVANRLQALNLKGRSITLQVMRRKLDAPIDPPKFLGHGICDTFNKSSPLHVSGGGPTSDGDVIGQAAWAAMVAMNLEPIDLRGIGIMIQKLEAVSTRPDQARLPFAAKASTLAEESQSGQTESAVSMVNNSCDLSNKQLSKDVTEGSDEGNTTKERASSLVPVTVSKTPRLTSAEAQSLPTLSQIDPGFLEELPPTIRHEIEDDIAKSSKARQVPRAQSTVQTRASTLQSRSRESSLSIASLARPLDKQKNKTKDLIATGQSQARALTDPGSSSANMTLTLLRASGIDLEVFKSLPRELQLSTIGDLKRISAHSNKVAETHKLPEISRTEAQERLGTFKLSGPSPTELFTLHGRSETEQVREVITSWVEAFASAGPVIEDVEDVSLYFTSLAERSGDLEKLVLLLQWWNCILERQEVSPNWQRALEKVRNHVQDRVIAKWSMPLKLSVF